MNVIVAIPSIQRPFLQKSLSRRYQYHPLAYWNGDYLITGRFWLQLTFTLKPEPYTAYSKLSIIMSNAIFHFELQSIRLIPTSYRSWPTDFTIITIKETTSRWSIRSRIPKATRRTIESDHVKQYLSCGTSRRPHIPRYLRLQIHIIDKHCSDSSSYLHPRRHSQIPRGDHLHRLNDTGSQPKDRPNIIGDMQIPWKCLLLSCCGGKNTLFYAHDSGYHGHDPCVAVWEPIVRI